MSMIPNVKALEGAIFASVEERLGALLEHGLGLAPTAGNLAAFAEQCRYRAAGLGLSESAYHDLLAAGGPSVRSEWLALSPVLTVGETFLFRDNALWKLVEHELLPGLAKLTKPVWLWSAGCSTGEEAYTLAIVARRALGHGAFSVLGTDVNPKAVAAARVGAYTQWSLRGVEHTQLEGLVISGTQTVRIHDDVKKDARFETHNLLDEAAYPPSGMTSFECIVCRNVLIYMTLDARAKVIARLAGCLTPGGVLVLGHGEASGVSLGGLTIERHDACVVYRKPLGNLDVRGLPTPAKASPRKSSLRSKDGARAMRPQARPKHLGVRPRPRPHPPTPERWSARARTSPSPRARPAPVKRKPRNATQRSQCRQTRLIPSLTSCSRRFMRRAMRSSRQSRSYAERCFSIPRASRPCGSSVRCTGSPIATAMLP
jgi:chemotaxis protein methyltransferase CheR